MHMYVHLLHGESKEGGEATHIISAATTKLLSYGKDCILKFTNDLRKGDFVVVEKLRNRKTSDSSPGVLIQDVNYV